MGLPKWIGSLDRPQLGLVGLMGSSWWTRAWEAGWNSTYLTLDATLKHKKASEEVEFHDMKYIDELAKGKGVPFCQDWKYVEFILPFLGIFHEATLHISHTSYVTSNVYMLEVANELKSRLESSLKLLFDEYNSHKEGTQNDTQQVHF
ncbi:hypothetical protein CR513_01208, partial [Mucuna pruriens]